MTAHVKHGFLCTVAITLMLCSPETLRGAEETWAPPADAWLVFASATCEECEWMKLEFLPDLEMRLDTQVPTVAFIDIDDLENYALLTEVEAVMKASASGDVPAFVVGDTMLYGKEAIAAWGETLSEDIPKPALPDDVLAIVAKAREVSFYADEFDVVQKKTAAEAQEHTEVAKHPDASREVERYRDADVLYFETTGCKSCARAEKQLAFAMSRVEGRRIRRVNTMETEGRVLHYAVAERLEIRPAKRLVTPMFVSGSAVLFEDTITDQKLIELLRQAPSTPFWQTWDEDNALKSARRQMWTFASGLTIPAVIAAGLVDGINPCAFAVIVFLVSYLTLTGRLGRKFALLYGLTFAAGVFVCYFLIGLGLFQILQVLENWQAVTRWVFVTMGVVCVGFGIGGVVDTVAAVRGGAAKMTFGMPKGLHRITHRLIREDVSRHALGIGAFLIGIAVSALELVCTGQIYLPIIMFINSTHPGPKSIGLLTLYNLAFILPLIAVVILGAAGLGSKTLSDWARRHAAATRALTTLLVFGLAAVMFVMAARA